jgi:mercuric ion transport protein
MATHTETKESTGTASAPPRMQGPNDVYGRSGMVAALGAVGAGFLASLCCVGPLLFVTLGVGAGVASRFEPLRPLFTALTIGLLAVGFYVVYVRPRAPTGEGVACAPDGSCVVPRSGVRAKILLWVATVVALAFLTFSQWSVLLV